MNLLTLKSMTLEHFRCFDSLDVDFDPQLTIFVGVNGSGKTTIIDAVAILLKYTISVIKEYDFVLDSIEITDIKDGNISSSIKYSYYMNNINKFEFTFSKIENPSFKEYPYPEQLKELRQQDRMPVGVCYSAQRNVTKYKRYTETSSFENAFSPEIDFSTTLTWFIEKASQEAREAVGMHDLTHRIPELSAVRTAVAKALGDYNEPYAGESPPRIFITHKDAPDTPLTLEQLSDGYRTMLALVMDLARRMAVANAHVHWKAGETVLHSPGIVLIDEVELHLHPSWQQKVLPTLMEIFPNVQFIVTTHSPQVISSLEEKHIRILDKNTVYTAPQGTWGAEASRILQDIFDVNTRPPSKATDELNEYKELVHTDQWDSPRAKELQHILTERYGDQEPELFELQLYIKNRQWEMNEEESA